MTEARIAPQEEPYSDKVREHLDRIMPKGVPPLSLFTTLARNERVFERFMAGGLLDKGTISFRQREIVIDRACARCGCEYEWGVHIAFFGERAALTPDQVQAFLTGPPDDPVWPREEQLLIQMVDELHETATVSDDLWRDLAGAFTDEQLIELTVLAGLYHMVSFVANTLKLPPESFAAHFPEV